MRLLNTLLGRSPLQNYWAFVRKVQRRRGQRLFTRHDLRTSKYSSPTAEIDRFERYARVCLKHGHADPRDLLLSSVVLELGCGPVLGIAPMAVFRGAEALYYSEPAFNPDLLRSEFVVEAYFRPLHAELCAQFHPASDTFLDFEIYYETLLGSCHSLDASTPEDAVDFVYSNSVLEHIPPEQLREVLGRVRYLCAPRARFLHAVDFTDHLGGAFPFEGIYWAEPPNDRGSLGINLLRPDELQDVFEGAGFEVGMIPYRRFQGDLEPLAPYWRGSPKEALAIRVAFFLGCAQ